MKIQSITLIFLLTNFYCYIIAQSVGIGTSSPSDALHIVGATNDDPLRVQVGTATKLRVLNNGGTTIGTNNTTGTPTNGLYVQGNTGLGINNPSDKLEVSGNVNITGTIKANGSLGDAGQVLQSNGNGTMSWADPCRYKYFEDFFNPENNPQSWTVPAGVTEIMVEMWGAGGGGSTNFGGGAGGYAKIIRNVTPGEVLSFNLGIGGQGISSNTAATSGSATTFPSGIGFPDHSVTGGSSGSTGLGGSASISNTPAISQYRLRGQSGKPQEISYEQISSTDFVEKIIYGSGGSAYGDNSPTGHGGILIKNNTTSALILTQNGRSGIKHGEGGGGGAGLGAPSFNSGGNGGNGYVIIRW